MPTDRWLTLERLYHAALERPAEERAAFVDRDVAALDPRAVARDGACREARRAGGRATAARGDVPGNTVAGTLPAYRQAHLGTAHRVDRDRAAERHRARPGSVGMAHVGNRRPDGRQREGDSRH